MEGLTAVWKPAETRLRHLEVADVLNAALRVFQFLDMGSPPVRRHRVRCL